jgi:hypothetical protein
MSSDRHGSRGADRGGHVESPVLRFIDQLAPRLRDYIRETEAAVADDLEIEANAVRMAAAFASMRAFLDGWSGRGVGIGSLPPEPKFRAMTDSLRAFLPLLDDLARGMGGVHVHLHGEGERLLAAFEASLSIGG